MQSITLYSYVTSPYAMKVHCYLLYKQLPFKIIYVSPLKLKEQLPIHQLQIPVLKIGDEARGESSLIGIWLDESFPYTLPLLPTRALTKKRVLAMDHWISDTLIPLVFYSIYPQCNQLLLRNIKNAMRLGYCVDKTTTSGLPLGIRFLWPLFLRHTQFIKHMAESVKKAGSVAHCREAALSYLDNVLQDRQFLASSEAPSLADFSAWPLLIVPHDLGLKGFDDFKSYPNLNRWITEIAPLIKPSKHAPPLIPKYLLN